MSFLLEIRVPEEIVLQRDVVSIQAGDATGRFGIHSGHEPFMTVLTPGIVAFRDTNGREGYAAADGGVLLVEANRAFIVSREVVLADSLDHLADAAAEILGSRQEEEHLAHLAAEQIAAMLLRELRQVRPRP
jgi:F-type H+-transporting ATPase subunit epsilon